MKKMHLSKKIKWMIASASGLLLVPTVAISAVACSSQGSKGQNGPLSPQQIIQQLYSHYSTMNLVNSSASLSQFIAWSNPVQSKFLLTQVVNNVNGFKLSDGTIIDTNNLKIGSYQTTSNNSVTFSLLYNGLTNQDETFVLNFSSSSNPSTSIPSANIISITSQSYNKSFNLYGIQQTATTNLKSFINQIQNIANENYLQGLDPSDFSLSANPTISNNVLTVPLQYNGPKLQAQYQVNISQSVAIIPSFQNVQNFWNNLYNYQEPQNKPTTIDTNVSPYYVFDGAGNKTYLPLNTSSAISTQGVSSYFQNWINQSNIQQALENDLNNMIVGAIKSTYTNWNQLSYYNSAANVLLYTNITSVSLSNQYLQATLAKGSGSIIQLNNFNTSSQTLQLPFMSKPVVVPAMTSIGITLNLANAQLVPVLVPVPNSSNSMYLSYELNNASYTIYLNGKEETTSINNYIVANNPNSINAIVSGATNANGYIDDFKTFQTDYLENLTATQIANTLTSHGYNYFNQTVQAGEASATILQNLLGSKTLGAFLNTLGKPLGQLLQAFNLPSAISTLVTSFLSNTSVKDFLSNQNNINAIEQLLVYFGVPQNLQHIIAQAIQSVSSSVTSNVSHTVSPVNTANNFLNNLLDLANNLKDQGGNSTVQFIGNNFNLIFTIATQALSAFADKMPVNQYNEIQSILNVVQTIINRLQPSTIGPGATNSIMNIDITNVLSNPQTLLSIMQMVQQNIGPYLPPIFAQIITYYQKFLTIPNLAFSQQNVLNFLNSLLTVQVNGQASTLQSVFANNLVFVPVASMNPNPNNPVPLQSIQYTPGTNLLNANYTMKIVFNAPITWNLTPFKALLGSATLYDALSTFGILPKDSSLTWSDVKQKLINAAANLIPLSNFIENSLTLTTGEGVLVSFEIANAQLGVQYNQATNSISWTAPMKTIVTPMFSETLQGMINKLTSIIPSILKFIVQPYIDKYLNGPIFFYGRYSYSSFSPFDSASIPQSLVPQGINLNNTWALPANMNFNPNVMTLNNTITLMTDTNSSIYQAAVTSLTNLLNANVQTNQINTSGTIPEPQNNFNWFQNELMHPSKELEILYPNISANITAIEHAIFGNTIFIGLGKYFNANNLPYLMVNITPKITFNTTFSTANAALRTYSISLFFKTPVAQILSNGSVYLTNWIHFSI